MKIGIVLSGCGVMDGSEIHEAVLSMLCVNQAGAETICMAPAADQMHVVNHISSEPVQGENRNTLLESARIARGDIRDIGTVSVSDIDALIIPGGFGAAKNLCTFAVDGAECRVDPDAEKLISAMLDTGKPVGALCIAPVLVAKIAGGKGIPVQVTIGNDAGVAGAIEAMGAVHVECPVDRAVIDETHKVVTAPAYMLAKSIKEVAQSAKALVDGIMGLAGK